MANQRRNAPRRELKSLNVKDALRGNVCKVAMEFFQIVAVRALWETENDDDDEEEKGIASLLIAGGFSIFLQQKFHFTSMCLFGCVYFKFCDYNAFIFR